MINLKEKLNEKFYNDLIKCNFLDDVGELVNSEGLVGLDIDDFIYYSNHNIVGSISMEFNDVDTSYNINRINDLKITDCIVNITTNDDMELGTIMDIINKLRSFNPKLNLLYGQIINESMKSKFKVQALYLNRQ